MTNTHKKGGGLATLLSLMSFDSRRRFDFLHLEVEHLLASISLRMGENHADTSQKTGEVRGSKAGFLKRLHDSGRILLDDCQNDEREIRDYIRVTKSLRNEWLNTFAHGSSDGDLGVGHFDLFWHAKMVHKSTVLAERLGDLHDKLELFLQRTNPDHPDPTLRRRAESGLLDKYLSEFARWVHKDLVRFVKTMGAEYPYAEVPSTYQLWNYKHTSEHHSFIDKVGHESWSEWARERRGSRTEIPPKKFAVVSMSYWMPERQPLQAIIGHELAHQVLRDLFGRELNMPMLEHDTSQLGRLYRRVTTCVEQWLTARTDSETFPPKTISSFVVEIICDLLALARFGRAYQYAWFLEMLSDAEFANLFHDQFGILLPFLPEKDRPDREARTLDPAKWKEVTHDVFYRSTAFRGRVPWMYLRGMVLARAANAIEKKKDVLASKLDEAFTQAMGLLADIYSGPGTPERAYEEAFAKDLAVTVTTGRGPFRGNNVNSPFVDFSRRFWEAGSGKEQHQLIEPLLARQALSNNLRTLFESELRALTQHAGDSAKLEWPAVVTTMDVAWRAEWTMEDARLKQTDVANGLNEKHRNRIRTLLFLAMDDYLYRTGSPWRLLEMLLPKGDKTAGRDKIRHPKNTVDPKIVNADFDQALIENLDTTLAAWRSGCGHGPIEGPIELSYKQIDGTCTDSSIIFKLDSTKSKWLDRLLFDKAYLATWLSGSLMGQTSNREGSSDGNPTVPELLILDLMRLWSPDGVLGDDLNLIPKISLEDDYPCRLEPIASGALLGRYDAFCLAKQCTEEGHAKWQVVTGSEERQSSQASRTKKLVPIGSIDGLDRGEKNVFAIVMISLKWDASRLVCANWLTRCHLEKKESGRFFVFFSDGWEDLVVICCKRFRDNETDEDHSQVAFDLYELLATLNDNPFVATTETMFHGRVLKALPGTMSARFSCTFGELSSAEVRERVNKVREAFDDLVITQIAGLKDLELSLPKVQKTGREGQFHSAIHKHLNGNCRIETQIGWQAPFLSDMSPANGSMT
jgi:hypothetical protein